jgi:hypothetical protein
VLYPSFTVFEPIRISIRPEISGALGRGGPSIRIVREFDLVVVVTAGYYQDCSPRVFQVQYGVFRDVLREISPPG